MRISPWHVRRLIGLSLVVPSVVCAVTATSTETAVARVESVRGECAVTNQGSLRFLALGDSYTIGQGVETAERWPMQLAVLLRNAGLKLDEPTIVAKTGWTADELSAGIDQATPRGTYDLVSLLIGVNNQYRRRDLDEYRQHFAALLERSIEFAGGFASRVLVLSIPDWGVTPFASDRERAAIAGAIDSFNAVNRRETERLGAQYIDVTLVSRQAASNSSLIAKDGLHPSGKMYAEWARLAFPSACQAVGSGNKNRESAPHAARSRVMLTRCRMDRGSSIRVSTRNCPTETSAASAAPSA